MAEISLNTQTTRVMAAIKAHQHPNEILTVLGEVWFDCSCGERFDVAVTDGWMGQESVEAAVTAWRQHAADAIVAALAGEEDDHG